MKVGLKTYGASYQIYHTLHVVTRGELENPIFFLQNETWKTLQIRDAGNVLTISRSANINEAFRSWERVWTKAQPRHAVY